jgi:hypothetical protein
MCGLVTVFIQKSDGNYGPCSPSCGARPPVGAQNFDNRFLESVYQPLEMYEASFVIRTPAVINLAF